MERAMNTCYIDAATRSIADLVDFYLGGLLLTRINVPREHRGKGHARTLLARILADADCEGVTLWLEVNASDGLSRPQLIAWYERQGFQHHEEGLWQRAGRCGADMSDNVRDVGAARLQFAVSCDGHAVLLGNVDGRARRRV
jgi:hypothetical protein